MHLSEWQKLWHPESPGVRVVVRRWFPQFRRSEFATLGELHQWYQSRIPKDRTT